MAIIKEISVIIPAYNDEEIIEDSVETVLAKMSRLAERFEIILIDDCSTDHTKSKVEGLAKKHPEIVPIYHEVNLGVGSGLRSGFNTARYELVLTDFSDLPFDVDDLEKVVPYMQKENADICVMVRIDRSAHSVFRKFTSFTNYVILRLLFKVPIRDFQFCQLYKKHIVKTIHPVGKDVFVPPEMIIRAYDAGCKIVQYEAVFHPRKGGVAKYGKWKFLIATFFDQLRFWYRLRLKPKVKSNSVR